MKKYGIITHYDVHNHGALLQLYALKQVLRNMGIEAQALQFDKNYDFMGRELKAKYEIGIKSIGIYLKFLFERGFGSFLFNYKKKKLLDKFKREKDLIGGYYTEYDNLDAVVIGSDEVFALHTGPTPVFFGYALPSDKVFSYAGCFGPTTINDIDKSHCRAFVEGGLRSMCGLSMRDQNSIQIAKELTGFTPELVCDPVILYGFEDEIKGKPRPIQEKYMVVYAYDVRMNDKIEVATIKRYAKDHSLKIVSPGFYHSWADMNVNVDPIELINWFNHSECVVTDTFHGAVMSIITGRDMAIKIRDNGNKLRNLMEEYNLKNRQIGDNEDLEQVFSSGIDWEDVVRRILSARSSSQLFLSKVTNGND